MLYHSLNVSRYGDMSIYCCISNHYTIQTTANSHNYLYVYIYIYIYIYIYVLTYINFLNMYIQPLIICEWILENKLHYTHMLLIHSAITRLGWLECFSRESFDDNVNSWRRQWDPWRALRGRHGSKIDPSGRKTSLRSSKHVWAYGWHFCTHSYVVQTVLTKGLTQLQLHILPHQPPTLPPANPLICNVHHSWYYSGCEKICSKSGSVS